MGREPEYDSIADPPPLFFDDPLLTALFREHSHDNDTGLRADIAKEILEAQRIMRERRAARANGSPR